MPGEEMEITTDFGHAGFGEDIDIDLDFAVGQPDEDLELADFDQAQEMQNFNTDTRDELMAEGDDASYGMIDADDVEHNEGPTTVNDIEIDLADPDENLWNQNASHEETLQTLTEIDYVEDADVDNSTVVNVGEASWLETSAYPVSNANEAELAQSDVAALDTTSSHLPQDNTIPAEGVDTQDFGLSETRDDAKAPSNNGNDDDNLEGVAEGATNEQQNAAFGTEPQQPAEGSVLSKDVSEDSHNDVQLNGDVSEGNVIHEAQEHEQFQAYQNEVSQNEISETGHIQGDNSEHEEKPSTSIASAHGSVSEPLDQQEDQTGQHDPSLEASEQQLGGDSYAESTNDPESVQSPGQEENRTHDVDETHSRSDYYDPENEDQEEADANQNDQISSPDKAHVEHPLSIATRHEMYISYGQTDYRLFAKSEDDDPNQYFLRDMSAMDLPLGQFLSNLREIIADEVSVLDELVMHIDGLGLEFSESSTNEMLEEFTFGDILSLYDKLVKNDGTESAPCLYMYLMVRPNCHQRLMALLDSANAGRGLSEIAVYREITPVPDEQADNPRLHSPYASSEGEEADETGHGSNSPAQGEEGEDSYEYGENAPVEDRDEEHSEDEAEEHVGSKSSAVYTPAAEANPESEGPEGQAEESEENTKQDAEEDTGVDADGEVIDFSDDELDLSSSKQDQQADAAPPNHDYVNQDESNGVTTAEHGVSNQHTPLANESADGAHSEATSASATLNGDDNDEIDYSDNDGEEIEGGQDDPPNASDVASTNLKTPIDDEITWESDDEDVKNETTTAPKTTVQVSPSSGKRRRSNSDLLDDSTGQNDVKRRRPS